MLGALVAVIPGDGSDCCSPDFISNGRAAEVEIERENKVIISFARCGLLAIAAIALKTLQTLYKPCKQNSPLYKPLQANFCKLQNVATAKQKICEEPFMEEDSGSRM
jgi:hypothetical protein